MIKPRPTPEMIALVQTWVDNPNNKNKECQGGERRVLMAQLMAHPHRPDLAHNKLSQLLGNMLRVQCSRSTTPERGTSSAPSATRAATARAAPRSTAPTTKTPLTPSKPPTKTPLTPSKLPAADADRIKRREIAVAWLKKKGYADEILDGVELKATCQHILDDPLSEFNNRSLWDLMHDETTDFAAYLGETKLHKSEGETLKFMGTRAANRPQRKDGVQLRNSHVLGQGAPNSERKHFTEVEAK
jgi:hypothetical protein